MIARPKTRLTRLDFVSAAAGLLLAISPWLTDFNGNSVATANAVLCGFLMLAFTGAALFQLPNWSSWMNLMPGVWVLLSPWILGFATHVVMSAIHIAVGLIVSTLAMLEVRNTETLYLED